MCVSVAGLGCGGGSRLGKNRGMSKAESVALVRTAMDLGVNYLDTANSYTTEDIVGEAIKAVPRDHIFVGTKSLIRKDGRMLSVAEVVASLDNSLRELDTDYVDVFQFHAITPETYDDALNVYAPALLKEKEKGKLRFLGFTESPPNDANQEVLKRAANDDVWEAIMLGFHMMHQNARHNAFPYTQEKGIGTLLMFVVRSIFSIEGRLQSDMKELAAEGKVPQWLADRENPLDFLIHDGGAASVIDAAYRYARHEPGADIILFGTGSVEHLKTNLASILAPPLPKQDTDRLEELFGHLYGVGLDVPVKRTA
ncbi:MAG: aldo/keto reductase [Proteobacteria bacterium]|nr:aldo/keto reductase [Pseudomonadota bacterium]